MYLPAFVSERVIFSPGCHISDCDLYVWNNCAGIVGDSPRDRAAVKLRKRYNREQTCSANGTNQCRHNASTPLDSNNLRERTISHTFRRLVLADDSRKSEFRSKVTGLVRVK